MFMCRVISCVVGRGCLLWPVRSLGKTLSAFALLHSVLQGQTCLLLQVSLDFLLLQSSPLWWKGHLFFGVSTRRSRSGKRSLDIRDFPDSSVGKESACNAGDPGSIPVLGRCLGEGIGYLLRYTWASLIIQLVENLPAMWETWDWFRGWEDPLEKRKATCSIILT